MTENLIPDGNTRHESVINVMNCFFCMKDKPNCGAYAVNLRENCDPILEPYRGQRFAICKECQQKGDQDPKYLAAAIIELAVGEDKLKKLDFRKRKKRKR